MREILFHHKSKRYSELTNSGLFPVCLESVIFRSNEHYYHWSKFLDPIHREKILLAQTATQAYQLGRSKEVKLRTNWEHERIHAMRRVLKAKFSQHPRLRHILAETDNARLIEDTDDRFWGRGKDGNGRNMMGLLLMETRDELALIFR